MGGVQLAQKCKYKCCDWLISLLYFWAPACAYSSYIVVVPLPQRYQVTCSNFKQFDEDRHFFGHFFLDLTSVQITSLAFIFLSFYSTTTYVI
jgi:hypothetical protein